MLSAYDSKGIYAKILNLDESIRFVGRIKDRKKTSFVRRDNLEPLFDEEMSNMAYYMASFKARMEKIFDRYLGKTNWTITPKEFVKLITIFLDDGLLIISIDAKGDHDRIIKKIQALNIEM